MRYLCHLWPVRAVERISLRPPYDLDLSAHLLVLLRKKDYWTYFTVSESAARQLWPGAYVVGDLRYGVSRRSPSSRATINEQFDAQRYTSQDYYRLWDHDQHNLDIVDSFFRGSAVSLHLGTTGARISLSTVSRQLAFRRNGTRMVLKPRWRITE